MTIHNNYISFVNKFICPCSSVWIPARLASSSARRGQKFTDMEYFVYILKSVSTNKTYVGITNNLERRLKEHNSGKSKFTKSYIPWEMVYSEKILNREFARDKEKYFKSAAGRKRIKELIK